MAHTPGPWSAKCFDSDGSFAITTPENWDLFYSASFMPDGEETHPNTNPATRTANALLAAAAPELLAALEAIISSWDAQDNEEVTRAKEGLIKNAPEYSVYFQSARAVIHKAKGE